ncbi:DNA polymerase III, subunit gamma and tau [Streptococcus urinalis FB127-CNA-2]|uniref:DNA-directed DNA polymerase n=1 Tax=Streptococcus urinalis 2285-97 TaxID=764291 RepID=G5KDN3_9STRE|nr:DNA polymerase III subunit gamma/tau [Streptococcus urinalis]EHJ56632.1 DNA polymerase III, subunit gamma and tau [Streptococcus urinalis 2285-97]EKS19421.1 DNA polymerase III, subunit gamma and tau [Streptococcus urinalis FB127-CNA-2]VEF31552.1 DNA polymerase III subunits gamma and tau [Streptococcus urinalis]
MYQALYRKYRSQTFHEMVGQTVVSTTLKQAVETGKISHAYLFSGPRGTGKTSAAKIFAKAMNCPNQVNGEPCNQCDICRDITNGSLEDVIEIDAASNNGVDEIREIRDKSTYAPSRATYKVYIIDEVHMLSTGAFNALLKTLEEPTENVVFILATTELHKIPATILSRVQRFEFKTIKQIDIKNHLITILENEGISYDTEALDIISRRAEGGMRDALSILDQALSLTTDAKVSQEIAEEITGTISLSLLDDYVQKLLEKDAASALAILEQLFEQGKSMQRFATDLLLYFRDLLMVKSGSENLHQSALFELNLEMATSQLFQMINIVTESLPAIKQGTHPKVFAEVMTIKLTEVDSASHTNSEIALSDSLNEELSDLRRQVSELKTQLEKFQHSNQEVSTRVNQKTQVTYKIDKGKILTIMQETVADSLKSRQYLDALKGAWNDILDSISAQDRALLLGSEPVLANSENAILAFDAAFNAEQAMKRTDLNTIFGNIMSQAAGFSPNILAVPRQDFNQIRSEFASQMKKDKPDDQAQKEEPEIPEGFDFLAGKINTIED